MDTAELIRTRKSVRTFDGRRITDEHRKLLSEYLKTIDEPFGIGVEFILLDARENGLSSPVILGEDMYLLAKAKKTGHTEEAFGIAFEKAVLYAWSLGLGTTWIGGTMKREIFERAAKLGENEIMPCITPLGYPAKKRSLKEIAMRAGVGADRRKPPEELFFENSFSTPLKEEDPRINAALEAVRLAPSAVNKQPWRILRCGRDHHFYEYRSLGGSGAKWDIQRVDMGIALHHFMLMTGGSLKVEDPRISENGGCVYIATVTV
ncbi:MAG: nitroreductase family protein [Oscillospiraceae bacterium]|nr:nitroreductase family protein [Oscillospiraceae bacterium]